LATVSNRFEGHARGILAACVAIVGLGFPLLAAADDPRAEILKLQAGFIADLNKGDFARIAAAYHDSYQGLVTEEGYMTLEMRKNMFRTAFASDDRAFVTVLETEVRPLGATHALLSSHIKVDYTKSPTKDWWYTAIYLRSEDSWKIIHEH